MLKRIYILFVLSLFLASCGVGRQTIQETQKTTAPKEASTSTRTALPPSPTVTLTPRPRNTPQPTATLLPTATRWRPSYPGGHCDPAGGRKCQILFVMPMESYATHAERMPSQFRGAGYDVVIASNGSGELIDCDNVQTPSLGKKLSIDIPLADVQVSDYDAIIYVGGYGCREQWMDAQAHRIAQDAVAQGIVLGAAGCAPTILAEAGVLDGRLSVMYSGQPPVKLGQDYCEKIESLGAICSDQEIVRDGLIITAWPRSSWFVPGILQAIEENSSQSPSPAGGQATPDDAGVPPASFLDNYQFPEQIDPAGRHLFYVHGRIIEDQGLPAISPDFGEYEYEAILEKLGSFGFSVIAEQRPQNTDVNEYAQKLAKQVVALRAAGVPGGNITVVGASKGAYITILTSHYLQNNKVNFVILAICNPEVVEELMTYPIILYGNVLSIYDSVDNYAGSCQEIFTRSEGKGLSSYDEIVLNIGTGHGILYQPLDEWILPVVEWANRRDE